MENSNIEVLGWCKKCGQELYYFPDGELVCINKKCDCYAPNNAFHDPSIISTRKRLGIH